MESFFREWAKKKAVYHINVTIGGKRVDVLEDWMQSVAEKHATFMFETRKEQCKGWIDEQLRDKWWHNNWTTERILGNRPDQSIQKSEFGFDVAVVNSPIVMKSGTDITYTHKLKLKVKVQDFAALAFDKDLEVETADEDFGKLRTEWDCLNTRGELKYINRMSMAEFGTAVKLVPYPIFGGCMSINHPCLQIGTDVKPCGVRIFGGLRTGEYSKIKIKGKISEKRGGKNVMQGEMELEDGLIQNFIQNFVFKKIGLDTRGTVMRGEMELEDGLIQNFVFKKIGLDTRGILKIESDVSGSSESAKIHVKVNLVDRSFKVQMKYNY